MNLPGTSASMFAPANPKVRPAWVHTLHARNALRHLPASAIDAFRASWNDLPEDPYIAGPFRYRRRRFSEFRLGPDDSLAQLPPAAFVQSAQVNVLFGGVQRRFEPLRNEDVSRPVLHALVRWAAASMRLHFDAPSVAWRVGVHAIRIEAEGDRDGLPTPEGLHRDGHAFVATVLIGRDNVRGATSEIYDPGRRLLLSHALEQPFEAILVDDAAVLHAVTPLRAADPRRKGTRDVCLVTFDPAPASTEVARAARPNLLHAVRAEALDFADRLARQSQTAGVVLLGGLALCGERRYVDDVSDLDFCLFLDLPAIPPTILDLPFEQFSAAVQPFLPPWLPNFKFRTPTADPRMTRTFDVDVHQMILQRELRPGPPWPAEKLEAFRQTADVVHDRAGAVRRLIDAKVGQGLGLLRDQTIAALGSAPVRLHVDVARCLARGLHAEAHLVVTLVLHELTKAVYWLNDRFPPNPKWMYAGLATLPWQPGSLADAMSNGALVLALDATDVQRRTTIALRLLAQISAHYDARPGAVADPYTWASTRIHPDRQLRYRTAADELVPAHLIQDRKMDIDRWRAANWTLRSTGSPPSVD